MLQLFVIIKTAFHFDNVLKFVWSDSECISTCMFPHLQWVTGKCKLQKYFPCRHDIGGHYKDVTLGYLHEFICITQMSKSMKYISV